MRIVNLVDCRQVAPALAGWHHGEWGHLEGSASLEERIDELSGHTPDNVPTTFVAWMDDQPVGSASIVNCDMESHEELFPWLASVFVLPAFRRNGIARSLVRTCLEAARNMGLEKLYLWTHNARALYASEGWKDLAYVDYKGKTVVIMVAEL
jgi:predicted N-acetyltransferase YhbS